MRLFPLQRVDWQMALALSIGALVVRGLFVALYPATALAGGDPRAYWSYAQGIVAGQGFRATVEPWLADRPPLYSYFLAGVFKLLGEHEMLVFGAQAVLGAVGVGLFTLTVVRLMGTLRGGVAGALLAVLPHALLFTKQILTESLYLFLLVGLLALLLLPAALTWRWGLIIGVTVGLLALVRREAILLAVGLVVWSVYWRARPAGPNPWVVWGVAGGLAGLVVAPWLIRNWVELGAPVMSSSSGWNFMVGNNPLATGRYTPPPAEWASQVAGLTELERDRMAWDLSLAWIRQNPLAWLRLLPLKFVALWGPANSWLPDLADVFLLLASGAGLWRLRQREANWLLIAGLALTLIVGVTLGSVLVVGGWRYRFAVYPGVLLLAAYGLPVTWVVANATRAWRAWRAHGR